MIEIRCKGCNKLLMKATTVVAAVKCGRCGKIFEYKAFSNLHMTNSYDIMSTRDHIESNRTKR